MFAIDADRINLLYQRVKLQDNLNIFGKTELQRHWNIVRASSEK